MTLALALLASGPIALHHARVDGDALTWTTEILASDHGVEERWALVEPLSSATQVLTRDGLEVVRDAEGRIVALSAKREGARRSIELRAPLDRRALRPPLLGALSQRVSVEPPARFVPDARAGLEPRVGYFLGPGISEEERDRVDAIAYRRGAKRGALYLGSAGTVPGELLVGASSGGVSAAVALAFAFVVAGLFAARAGLAKRAERERADAALREELDALGDR